MVAQDIRAVSFAPSIVFGVMEQDKYLVRESFMDVSVLRTMFDEYGIREALEVRGLLWPHELDDNPSTRCLHFELDHILKCGDMKISYLSSWRLMEILICTPRDFWLSLLDFLSWQRTIIYLDWKVKLTSWISYAVYDFGVNCPPDDATWYKSESDASWDTKKRGGNVSKEKQEEEKVKNAHVGVLIWRQRKVVWCEIYKDFPCKSSVVAEAIGMYLQLKRSIGLHYLQPHTDNDTIRNVVVGKVLSGLEEEDTKFFELLRVMIGYFKRVAPRRVPREELSFVDGLLRNPKVMKHIGTYEEQTFIIHDVVKKWKPHLSGDPIFTIMPEKRNVIGNCLLSPVHSCLVC